MKRVLLCSPAKVNLGLWVGERRPDGYHEIVTTLVPLTLCDTITIAQTPLGIEVTSTDPSLHLDRKNLAYRAAELFFRAAGIEPRCHIHIRKRIPIGAGLGGGSSNAAAVLIGLNRLYGKPLSPRVLRSLALKLGSDCPFFLKGCACVARGRGERLRRVKLPRLTLILHYPGYPISTAWAYQRLDRLRKSLTDFRLSPKILCRRLRRQELARVAGQVRNSFEPVVFEKHPDLAVVKRRLLEAGAYAAALSGSGSTVYGLVEPNRWHDPMAAMRRHGLHCVLTQTR